MITLTLQREKRRTEGTRKSKRQAKKSKKQPEKVIVQNSPEDDLEESEQPASGSELDVNRQDDEENEQPSARSEPDVNTQEVEGSEDSQPDEDRNTDTKGKGTQKADPVNRSFAGNDK
nr:hypothetical protein Iba_chr10cCG9260 [Ipomoea batatas]